MLEIERKFLVDTDKWMPQSEGEKITQGYLSTDKKRVVRVRTKGEKAFLTIKGETEGITRPEFEYEIPVRDALQMLTLCKEFVIEKRRYTEVFSDKTWEIDVFENLNEGLVIAEVELDDENENVELPGWITQEVSLDKRYFNAFLSQSPYTKW